MTVKFYVYSLGGGSVLRTPNFNPSLKIIWWDYRFFQFEKYFSCLIYVHNITELSTVILDQIFISTIK